MAFEPRAAANLVAQLHGLAEQRGILIPPNDPYPHQQAPYERYLRSHGLDPSRVDKVIDMARMPEERRGVLHGMILHALINNTQLPDDEFRAILTIAEMIFAEHRATGLLRTIAAPLIASADNLGGRIDSDTVLGVFPFRWFNGQSTLFEGKPVCLVATGTFDLIEIFTTLFEASRKDADYAAIELRRAIQTYVKTGSVDPATYGLADGLVDHGSLTYAALTTSAEQFVIAHELAHVALGHVDTSDHSALPVLAGPWHGRPTVDVINPDHFDELCADVRGLCLALEAASRKGDDSELAVACAGAPMFLGLALLIEAARREEGNMAEDSHPSALTRLYLIDLALELTGNHERAYIARRVREFVDVVGQAYPSFEAPPFLSRELNAVAVPVFEHLGFDLSNASHITDFQ